MSYLIPNTDHTLSALPTAGQIRKLRNWVTALRSGKYAQTESVLHDPIGYCCLGVACDLTRKRVWINAGGDSFAYGKTGEDKMPPGFVNDHFLAGIRYTTPGSDYPYYVTLDNLPTIILNGDACSRMNDHGSTFEEIADVLEQAIDVLAAMRKEAQ